MPPTVTEIWRYPVKSMGGERLDRVAVGERGVHADRMWAVRDLARDAISTARQLPPLLKCAARYAEDPGSRPAAPGDRLEVIITLPDGEEMASSDPSVHARLSEVIGKEVRLEPLPPLSEKERYRLPRPTKTEMREYFGVPDGEPLPDLSMMPLRKLAELSRYVTPLGAFYDAYPVHLITSASIAAMAERAPGSDFDTRRFRPNVVVELGEQAGLPENAWCGASLAAPDATLRGEIPTVRCVMPTREQLELPGGSRRAADDLGERRPLPGDLRKRRAARDDRCRRRAAGGRRPDAVTTAGGSTGGRGQSQTRRASRRRRTAAQRVIRRCADDERGAILAIVNAAAEAYRGVIPPDRWHEPYMPAEELDVELAAGVEFWGYERAGVLTGVMGIQRVRDVQLIRHAYVLPSEQGSGVGRALLDHLVARADAPLLVGTWAAAAWAIRFYERNGFSLVTPARKDELLRAYWDIPDRQVATSVVLERRA